MKHNRSQGYTQGAQDTKPLAPFWWRDRVSMKPESAATRARDHRVLCEALADMRNDARTGARHIVTARGNRHG